MSACRSIDEIINIPPEARKVVLVGNPNVGKSVFFNVLTGRYAAVSNFPGTTVDVSSAPLGEDVLIDTPGIYGVSSFNDEELVAREIIVQADIVINVVDAPHMERDLFLTLQLIDMGIPVVVALNMMDEARRNGMDIDAGELSRILGVTVVPTVAVKGNGIEEIKEALKKPVVGNGDTAVRQEISELPSHLPVWERLLALEGDCLIELPPGVEVGQAREQIYLRRRERVTEIIADVVQESNDGLSFSARLSRWMIRPLTGIPILLLTLIGVYYLVGVFIAQTVVEVTEGTLMGGYVVPFIRELVGRVVVIESIAGQLLVGEFGVLTMTLTYLFGLLLPLVVGFYLVLSLLEDSGYLPRFATLVDRGLTGLGLNGKAVIPLILGLGCVTMATITTRVLGSKRERIIATVLLGVTIPCSAQMGVIAGMIVPLGFKYLLAYIVIIISVFIVLGTLMNKIIPGESSKLLMDLPTLRIPKLKDIIRKTANKTRNFLLDAGPLFVVGALAITLMQFSGVLDLLVKWLSPLTVGWLGLPAEASVAFIMGIIRRDFGAAGLYNLALTPDQILVALVTITLFVPCIATVLVIFKERGWRDGLAIWAAAFAIAFLVGGLTAFVF